MSTPETIDKASTGRIALALQGGGAIGAFQAGVLEVLHEAQVPIHACCGSSIGAINAALFFGNPASSRIDRLRAFWDGVSTPGSAARDQMLMFSGFAPLGDNLRRMFAEADQGYAMSFGIPGLFTRRLNVPWTVGAGDPGLASVMDTRPLMQTLTRLCDFGALNASETRVSVIAANVATGQPRYFDNRDDALDARMIVASGSLPPWFPAVEIDGAWYWDGSLVTAAPLRRLIDTAPPGLPTTVLRADLWSPDGPVPDTITDAEIRQKNIEHGSRAAEYYEALRESQQLKALLAHALESIDASRRASDPQLVRAASMVEAKPVNVVPVDYRRSQCVSHYKDGQFGRAALAEHWRRGRDAAEAALARMNRGG
ncbi:MULTISPECIES: patatin-like phospholipase family protein [unclassified Caballeronia]|uniref:patatin-like phospholipase family protein n=1 Tax=unclassified Caballeronia TaxID=2646786 RepID=UPI00286298F7|nr:MULTISPECIES: patatin-like phospholipase family protein [unclassified Caballeronia]MDR5740793.1 patatin-like phospholipase family protein [Caballeronia sp. LZ016]MDR5808686.1 patatin-like phospholipase family protein [Caballeronia sp. LZ019]